MKYTLSLFLFITLFLVGCSDKEDEPINSVFAFSSSDSDVSITNGGTHAVVNVPCIVDEDVKINLSGTFINAKIETESDWVKATIQNKVLTLRINSFGSDEARSANIAITANDQSEIVMAHIVVNQAAPTEEDFDNWEKYELADIVYGQCEDLPTDGNYSKEVWYKLNNDGTAFMRFAARPETLKPIKKGDVVYPQYAGYYAWDAIFGNVQDWYSINALVWNYDNLKPLTFNGINNADVKVWGEGMLLPLVAGISYGDDIDLIVTSKLGVPGFDSNHYAQIYAVQYLETDNSKPFVSAPAKLGRR